MKVKKLFMSLVILAVISPLFAQNYPMRAWNWSAARLTFKAPTALKVTKSTPTYFSGTWGAMGFSIIPSRDKNLGASQVAWQSYQGNAQTTQKQVTAKRRVNLGQGLKGYAIFGKGYQNNKAVKFVYLGLIDPRSPHNYSVSWVWYSTPKYDHVYDDMSYKMAQSFRKF